MENDTGTLLHLGSGKVKWPGWVGVDLDPRADIHADITALPYSDNHADAIAAVHVVEHFHAWEAPALLTEWYRVLKPGGRLILELPCMDKVMAYIYTCVKNGAPISNAMGQFVFWGDPKHQNPLMCHKWGYYKATILELLVSVGFKDARIEEPRYHFLMRDMRAVGVK